MTERSGIDRFGLLALLLATIACLAIVPSLPFAHLDDPAHWGVLGYFVTLALLLQCRWGKRPSTTCERRLLTLFLVCMPIIYVASRLRNGGTMGTLVLELVGAVAYWAIAWASLRRPVPILAAGIALHGLWDLAHYGRTGYVPDWYTLACFVVDIGVGIYAVSRFVAGRRTNGATGRRV